MAALGESITVVNKSGKIVSTSKHLVNVFKEARSAYLEKKAELKFDREDGMRRRATQKALEAGHRSPGSDKYAAPRKSDHRRAYSRDSSPSRYSSSSRHHSSRHRESKHRDSRHHDSRHHDSRRHDSKNHESSRNERKPSVQRGYSDSENGSERREPPPARRTKTQPIAPSHLRQSCGLDDEDSGSSSDNINQQIARRHSDSETLSPRAAPRHQATVSSDEEGVDMDLAYGEPPPPLPSRYDSEIVVEAELHNKMTTLSRLLEEANCVEHSVRAVIKNLEENPDAMAAVALTLAEISNLAARMAPSALASLKGSFPMVIGLLASSEFLIAGGVAIGVTVVMFGGYKIIKRIKANRLLEKEGEAEELEEITSDLDRIENWRRGIQLDDDNESVATTVDGEFITPKASMQLREQGVIAQKQDKTASSKKHKSERNAAKDEKKKDKKDKSDKEKQEKKDKSDKEKQDKKDKKELEKKEREKSKEPSGLMMLFKKDKEQIVA